MKKELYFFIVTFRKRFQWVDLRAILYLGLIVLAIFVYFLIQFFLLVFLSLTLFCDEKGVNLVKVENEKMKLLGGLFFVFVMIFLLFWIGLIFTSIVGILIGYYRSRICLKERKVFLEEDEVEIRFLDFEKRMKQ